jgi:hypothetical protein
MIGEAEVVLGIAGTLSLVASILVMVHAHRRAHPFWMAFILVFPPLGIAYVLIHLEGQRRWFKFATLVTPAAPCAVALAIGWRFLAFLR